MGSSLFARKARFPSFLTPSYYSLVICIVLESFSIMHNKYFNHMGLAIQIPREQRVAVNSFVCLLYIIALMLPQMARIIFTKNLQTSEVSGIILLLMRNPLGLRKNILLFCSFCVDLNVCVCVCVS